MLLVSSDKGREVVDDEKEGLKRGIRDRMNRIGTGKEGLD